MGARSIFSRGGQIKGLCTEVPQRGPGMEPRWGSVDKAPRSRQQVMKIIYNFIRHIGSHSRKRENKLSKSFTTFAVVHNLY